MSTTHVSAITRPVFRCYTSPEELCSNSHLDEARMRTLWIYRKYFHSCTKHHTNLHWFAVSSSYWTCEFTSLRTWSPWVGTVVEIVTATPPAMVSPHMIERPPQPFQFPSGWRGHFCRNSEALPAEVYQPSFCGFSTERCCLCTQASPHHLKSQVK